MKMWMLILIGVVLVVFITLLLLWRRRSGDDTDTYGVEDDTDTDEVEDEVEEPFREDPNLDILRFNGRMYRILIPKEDDGVKLFTLSVRITTEKQRSMILGSPVVNGTGVYLNHDETGVHMYPTGIGVGALSITVPVDISDGEEHNISVMIDVGGHITFYVDNVNRTVDMNGFEFTHPTGYNLGGGRDIKEKVFFNGTMEVNINSIQYQQGDTNIITL